VRLYPKSSLAGEPGDEMVTRRPADDLIAVLIWTVEYGRGQIFETVPRASLNEWGVSDELAWERGLDNIEAAETFLENPEATHQPGVDVVALFGNTTFGSTLALRLNDLTKRSFPYGALLGVPEDNLILYHAITGPDVYRARNFILSMATTMIQGSERETLSPHVYWWQQSAPWLRLTVERGNKIVLDQPAAFTDAMLPVAGPERPVPPA
jgi:hypothetical protein